MHDQNNKISAKYLFNIKSFLPLQPEFRKNRKNRGKSRWEPDKARQYRFNGIQKRMLRLGRQASLYLFPYEFPQIVLKET